MLCLLRGSGVRYNPRLVIRHYRTKKKVLDDTTKEKSKEVKKEQTIEAEVKARPPPYEEITPGAGERGVETRTGLGQEKSRYECSFLISLMSLIKFITVIPLNRWRRH